MNFPIFLMNFSILVDPKPGTCPILSPGTGGPCAETCRLDSDCQGVHKCCSNGCGHSCFPPGTSFI